MAGHEVSDRGEFLVEKSFDDFVDDIEAVTINYACSALGELPDWDQERLSRLMHPDQSDETAGLPRRRVQTLKLPTHIVTKAGVPTDHYLLHHYFEYWQGGSRHYSPHFSEEIVTGEANE